MKSFKFELGDRVKFAGGNGVGLIVGRAEYQHDENSYYVQYVAGHGCAVQQWWGESALEATVANLFALVPLPLIPILWKRHHGQQAPPRRPFGAPREVPERSEE